MWTVTRPLTTKRPTRVTLDALVYVYFRWRYYDEKPDMKKLMLLLEQLATEME